MDVLDKIKEKVVFSRLGDVPSDWKVKKLRSALDLLTDFEANGSFSDVKKNVNVYDSMEYAWYVRATDLVKQSKPEEVKYVDEHSYNFLRKTKLFGNELLLMKRGEIGNVYLFKKKTSRATLAPNLYLLNLKEYLNPEFLYYFFVSHIGQKSLKRINASSTMGALYKEDVKNLLIPIPTLKEQVQIAEILSTWDQAIEKTQNLIEKLELRKKGLIQELLSGKKRLPGFDGEWKKYEIAEIASQFTNKNSDNKISEVLSCTKYDGLVRSLEYFGRKVYGDDLRKYKVVPRNYFAYATNHIEEGSIGYQNLIDAGLVSPMYTVFKTNSKVDDSYLFRLLKTDRMIYHYQSNMSGSVARRGGLRWNTFKELIVKLPGIDEQKAIASLLNEADNELNLQSEHLETLKSQKKGLMQQLLTGKKRVSC